MQFSVLCFVELSVQCGAADIIKPLLDETSSEIVSLSRPGSSVFYSRQPELEPLDLGSEEYLWIEYFARKYITMTIY